MPSLNFITSGLDSFRLDFDIYTIVEVINKNPILVFCSIRYIIFFMVINKDWTCIFYLQDETYNPLHFEQEAVQLFQNWVSIERKQSFLEYFFHIIKNNLLSSSLLLKSFREFINFLNIRCYLL